MNVIGLDLALNATGICGDGWSATVEVPAVKNATLTQKAERMRKVVDNVTGYLYWKESTRRPDLVVIEALAWGASGMIGDIAGCWWMMVEEMVGLRIPVAQVSPTSLKKYCLGKTGKNQEQKTSKKEDILVAVLGMGFTKWNIRNNNEADAFVLYCMGMEHLGQPVMNVRATQREALTKVEWPVVTAPDPFASFG